MRRERLVLVVRALVVVAVTIGLSSCTVPGGKGKNAKTATFTVTGKAPSGANITYGRDGSNYQGPTQPPMTKTLHVLPPMTKTLHVDKDALYYDVIAQLHGGGDITCQARIGDAVKT